MSTRSSLVVFSHLRWNFVYQRPQHVLARLAGRRAVYFIEEAIEAPELTSPEWELSEPASNVRVLVPRLPSAEFVPGFAAPALQMLVNQLVVSEFLHRPFVWTYTPAAIDLISTLQPSLLIYDCMDELSAFLFAPKELRDQEARLLAAADMVFTGGPSLYRAKRSLHPQVYCFPSSVDVNHFRQGVKNLPEAEDQVNLPAPRLGFFGVLDERLDITLLREMATQRPDWQIVLVGPVVKIDPATLPQAPNIHYIGSRSYKDLPAYLKGWDVCLLPFAMNESTRFISPTKVLEYMAVDKPIVSTPITDVKEPYGDFVRIGATPAEFISQCDEALSATAEDRETRMGAGHAVLANTSWDRTAKAMEALIDGSIPAKAGGVEPVSRAPIVVAGAGPTGLSAAYHLGRRALLIEQHSCVGGWCRSIEKDGFTFDHAGHIMFSADPYVHQMYEMLLGDNVRWQEREAWIYSYGVYTRYPFQGSLYGLPPDVILECITGAIEARFGSIHSTQRPSPEARAGGATPQEKNGTCVKDCCADGLIEATAPASAPAAAAALSVAPPKNFEEFIYKVWGAGIAKHFAIPYNRKLWAVPLTEMETSWLGGRVPMPDLKEMIEGSLKPATKPMGPNARFGYPLRGGFQALMSGFLPHLKGRTLLNTRIVEVDPAKRSITLSDGKRVRYESLISTMPLPVLVRLMGDGAPASIKDAAARLRNISVRCVHIGVGREALTSKHWIYYPGDTVFHRVFVQGNASPHCNAPGGFGLTCEITYSHQKPLPVDGEELTKLAIQDCIRVGLFREDDPILTTLQVDMPYAYVVYDHQRKESVQTIREWMRTQNIVLAGRYSEWEYYNSDHAFIAGRQAAEDALNGINQPAEVRPIASAAALGRSA